MSNEKREIPRKPGRPKHKDAPKVLSLRVPESLVSAVESWAESHGISRNKAGELLLRRGLKSGQRPTSLQPSTGGYNPLTGEFNGT